MATIAETYVPMPDTLHILVARLTAFHAAWRKRRRIIGDLSAHSDRELADMGFTRDDIRAVADGSYRR